MIHPPLNKRRTIRNLVLFTVVVISIGFIGRGLDVRMGNSPSESLGMLLWLVVPSVFSLLLRAFGGDGWKDFGIRPNFKGNGKFYLVALLVYPVLTLIILLIGSLAGLITFPDLSMNALGMIAQVFLVDALPQFVKNIFEETAWRGYLAPKVYALGLNDFVGHAMVGLIWGAWHIPYYLYFLDRSILEQFTTLPVTLYIPLAILVMIAWGMVYGELRLLTNSIWPAVLMHMVEDALLIQLITDNRVQIVRGADWLVSPMHGLIGIGLFVALGIGLRQIRKRREATA